MLDRIDDRADGIDVGGVVAAGRLVGRAVAEVAVGQEDPHVPVAVVEPVHEVGAAAVVQHLGDLGEAPLGPRLVRCGGAVHRPLHPDGEQVLLDEPPDVGSVADVEALAPAGTG